MNHRDAMREMKDELIQERFDAMFDNAINNLLDKISANIGKVDTDAYEQYINSILEERGNRYGGYSEQRYAVGQIVDAMHHVYLLKHKEPATMQMLTDWFYLAMKLARIPADVTYADNYDDLIGYTQLIKDIHVGE